MAESREYKSDVFSMLMENREYALQVYNALNGSHYDDPELVEIVSLEKGISLSIRNDCAFIVDMSLNIYEHQSSYNPNMPLRALIYFTAYVKCTIYNINPDKDMDILEMCPILDEYMIFVECVRHFEEDGLEDPIEKAIDHCIRNHILEGFLKEHRAEVLKAMTIDMTFERREELIREEVAEEVRAEEQAKTERERKRAEAAERRVAELEAELTKDMTFEHREELIREKVRSEEQAKTERERKRADAAEKRVAELEAMLKSYAG